MALMQNGENPTKLIMYEDCKAEVGCKITDSMSAV